MQKKNKEGCVYKITNSINDKIYVGITTNSVEHRWSQHKSDAKHGSDCPIHRAIRKYGHENFSIETIDVKSGQELCLSEVEFIAFFKSTDSKFGYNASSGGENGKLGVKSWNSGKTKNNNEIIARVSLRQTGENNPFYGKSHSDEQKAKWSKERAGSNNHAHGLKRPDISERNRNKKWTKEEKDKVSKANGTPVRCVQNGIIYHSVMLACRELGLDERSVWRVLSGKFKQHRGYSFVHVEEK